MRGHFVLLRAGTLRLLLPQADVGAAGYLDAAPQAGDRRFAALSDDMTLLPECPPGRFITTTLGDAGQMAWCWDELQVLIDAQVDPIALPAAVLAADTPVNAYAELEGGPAFVTTGEAVSRYALGD
jgi:hypothetical protein